MTNVRDVLTEVAIMTENSLRGLPADCDSRLMRLQMRCILANCRGIIRAYDALAAVRNNIRDRVR